MSAADVIQAQRNLRAVRRFGPGAIPNAVKDDILDVARWTGTAKNRQAWWLIWIEDTQTMETLAGLSTYARHIAAAAAALAIVTSGEAEWEEQDVFDEGRLCERLMLTASVHGIGAGIGWLTGSGVEDAKRLLDIPPQRRLRTLIALGHPAEGATAATGRGGRKPLSELVFAERYGQPL